MGLYYIAYDIDDSESLSHHQTRGAHWGVHRGPPYPLSRTTNGRLNAKKQAERKRNSTQVYGVLNKKSVQSDDKKETSYDSEAGMKLKTTISRNPEKEAAADLAAVNPMIPPRSNGFYNCAYCSLAYDLRRRGYDVIAANKCGMTNDDVARLYKDQKVDWFLPESAYKKQLKPNPKQSKELNKWIRNEIGKQGRNSRGLISVAFSNDSMHSMVYENQNGRIRILDAQLNREYSLDKVTACSVDAMISRTDNLTPNYDAIREMRAVRNVRS